MAPGQQKAGQTARLPPANLAAPAPHPNPPGSLQVFGLPPVAAVPHHPAHRLALAALPRPGTEFVPLIFDVWLDFWPKGDYLSSPISLCYMALGDSFASFGPLTGVTC